MAVENWGQPTLTAVVDIKDPEALKAALEGVTVVINCAGPFQELGAGVVEAAISVGAHYLDCTGEQSFIRHCYDELDDQASEAGSLIVNAMAFEYALGTWLGASLLGEGEGPLAVKVLYRLDTPMVTRGTYLSMKKEGEAGGYGFKDGMLTPMDPAEDFWRPHFPGRKRKSMGVFVPLGECHLLPRGDERIKDCMTFMSFPKKASRQEHLLEGEKAEDGQPFGPTDEERAASTFGVAAEVVEGEGNTRRAFLEGVDPYGTTAKLLTWGTQRILLGEAFGPGVLSPEEAFGSGAGLGFLLEEEGFSVAGDDG